MGDLNPQGGRWPASGRGPELLGALNALAATLQRSPRSEQAAYRAFAEQVAALGLRGGIALLDSPGRSMVEGHEPSGAGADVCRNVLEAGQTVFAPDSNAAAVQVVPHAAGPLLEGAANSRGGPPAIYAPLVVEGRIHGVLNLVGNGLAPGDAVAVEAFAHLVAAALENARLSSALGQAEALHEATLRQVSEAVFVTDASGNFASISPGVAAVFGYTAQEAREFGHVSALLGPDLFSAEEMEASGEIRSIDREVTDKAGQARSLLVDVRRLSGDGAMLYTCRDVTERRRAAAELLTARKAEETLRRQDRVLQAVAFAAERFLREPDWEQSVQEVLSRLGEGAEVSRVYIFQACPGLQDEILVSQRYEWAAPGVAPQIGAPELQNFPLRAGGFGRWQDRMARGEVVHGHIREFPPSEQALLAPQDIRSIVAVPVMVGSSWWGFIGFDECTAERDWSSAEMDALRAAAGTLSAAIQRGQAEAALRTSEERYRTLAEAAHDAIFIVDRDDRLQFLNSFAARLLGGRPEDFCGQLRGQLFPAGVSDRQRRNLQQVFDTGQPSYVEDVSTFPSGEAWLGTQLVPIRGRDGDVTAVMGISRDITERKRVEEELRRTEERFRILYEEAPDAYYLSDLKGMFLDGNRAAEQMVGFSAEELVGKSFLHLNLLSPGQLPRAAALLARNALGHSTGPDEFTLTRRDGTRVPVEIRTVPLKIEGRTVVLGIARDVTARVQAEQALRDSEALNRAVLGSLTAHIAVLDQGGTIIAVNEAWERFARENGDGALAGCGPGVNYLEICRRAAAQADDEAQQVLVGIGAVLGGSQSRFTLEYACHSPQAEHWYLMKVTPLAGEQAGVVVAHEPVTERVRAQRARQESEKRFRALIEHSSDAVSLIAADGTILYTSPATTRILDYEIDEFVGLKAFHLVHPDDLQAASSLFAELLNRPGVSVRGQFRFRKKDRSYRWVEAVGTNLLAEPSVQAIVTNYRDDTERVQHERELQALVTVSSALRRARRRVEMLPVILEQMVAVLEAEAAALVMLDPATGETVVEAARGPWAQLVGQRLPPGQGVSGHVIATGRPYVTNDMQNDPHAARLGLRGGVRAAAALPLSAEGQTLGVLTVGSQRAIDDDDLRLLNAIVNMAANALHRATLHEQTERRLQRLLALQSVDLAITASLDLRVTLNVLLSQLTAQLDVHAADVLLFNPHAQTLEFAAGRGFRSDYVERTYLRLGEGRAGQAVLERRTIHAADPGDGTGLAAGPGLAGEGFVAYYGVPLLAKGQVMGVLEIFHRAPLSPDPEWLDFLEMLARQAAIAIENAQLIENLRRTNAELALAYDTTLEGWSQALDLRDEETEGHTQRVTEMTVRLARAMGVGEAELVHLRRGALLHDIGKMGIPDGILLKPGRLSDEEWEVMRRHPQYAYDLLSPIAYLRPALDIPYCHHEKWDGTGYPRGLKGEQIPLAARIFAVVDVYDALRSDRPYRPAWAEADARGQIRQEAGKHFDPNVVEVFLRTVEGA